MSADAATRSGSAPSSASVHQHAKSDESPVLSGRERKVKPKRKSKVPDWIKNNALSLRSLRIFAKCWVAAWANFVLMLPGPSLRMLGQVAFFGPLMVLMVPPSMPFFLFLMAYTVLCLGALTGWAWGCASMAAAGRARNFTVTNAALRKVGAEARSTTNPEGYLVNAVFEGRFLDTKSTAVYGIFLMIGVYFAGVVQLKRPKLKIGTVFLMIVLDVMTTYGPLYPGYRYTFGEIFMIPIGCAFAIAIASQLLIFPETLAYSWQYRFLAMLRTVRENIDLHYDALGDAAQHHDASTAVPQREHLTQPSEAYLKQSLHAEDQVAEVAGNLIAKLKANRITISDQVTEINGMSAFLGMEFYRSYMDAHSMKVMFRKTRAVNLQLILLTSFWRLVHRELGLSDPNTFDENWDPTKIEDGYDVDGEHGIEALPTKDTLQPIRLHETHTIHRVRRDIFKSEAQQQVTMARMLHILDSIASPPLDAASQSIGAVHDYFQANAAWRKKRPIDDIVTQLHETKTNLEAARESLLNDKRLELLQPYAEHFRAMHPDLDIHEHFLQTRQSIKSFRGGVRPLHVCLVFVTALSDVLESISKLHEEMISISDRANNKKRIWWPKHLGRAITVLTSNKRGNTDGLEGFGPEDGTFDREEDIDRNFRQDNAGTATNSTQSKDTSVDDHVDHESDVDADEDDTLHSTAAGHRQQDEEKAAASDKIKSTKSAEHTKRERKPRYYARDPDALPPTNARHRIGRTLAAVYNFVTGTTGLYALRMCVATFAVWIPNVLPQSANFVYKNRGIWALIMAQTCFALSGGELVFTFGMRLIGTVVGLLFGAVLWYISAGNGNGNAIGLAATAAIGFIPLVFFRIFCPRLLLLPMIMLNTSVVLIIGYSWEDRHLAVLVNSGVGIGLAWKRTLLVVIGMTAALIAMIFPRPTSSRMLLRKSMAKVTRQLNETFVDVMEVWIARNRIMQREAERAGFANQIDATRDDSKLPIDEAILELWHEREPTLRARFMSLSAAIAGYSGQIAFATLDFQTRGRWPSERYVEIATTHMTILESIGSILASVRAFDGVSTSTEGETTIQQPKAASAEVDGRDWQMMLTSTTSLLDPQYLSEICMIFDLLSKALRNGERLNHASFSLLENHFKYGERNRKIDAFLRKKDVEAKNGAAGEVLSQGEDVLSWSVLRDPMYSRFTTARMAAITLASELDKLKAIVTDLVGESSLRGFDMLKEMHDERIYRAMVADAE